MKMTRRDFFVGTGVLLASIPYTKTLSKIISPEQNQNAVGNFQYIYGNSKYREEFFSFLVNVFHLYPQDDLHSAINKITASKSSDLEVYNTLQIQLDAIKPFLADLTYGIPALVKQKRVIANQTAVLVDEKKVYDGYLEIGSTGRYLDSLEEVLDIKGEIFFLSDKGSTYSPVDMIDRGQICKAGKDLLLNDYKSNLLTHIPKNSLDMVTVYIGFHHCPTSLREEFISSIRDVLKDNGVLILRDHDAHNEKMTRFVALAHDVFNMGTKETWKYNTSELRNFYSLVELEQMLVNFGFKSKGRKLFQDGDPTLNALMRFNKA